VLASALLSYNGTPFNPN